MKKNKIFAALALSLAFAASVSAAIPPAENLLPSDTLMFITAPDFTALRAASKQSPQWLFWNDPAMKPFHDKFMSNLNNEWVAPLEHDLGMKVGDFANLLQGQLTFAFTQNGWNGVGDQSPGIILLLDAKDKSGLLKTNLATLQKKWTDDGKSIRTETIRGISFSVITLSSNDIPATLKNLFPRRQPVQELGKENPPAKPGQLVIGQYESLLIVANSVKAAEPIAAHLTGGSSPALDDNSTFSADKISQFRDAPLYYGWFNAKTFFNVLSQIPSPQPNPAAPSPMPRIPWDKVLAASGLLDLKSASFNYHESHDGAQVGFYLSAPESARAGILKIFATANKDASAPVFVPADVMKFWRWRVDGQKSWTALETMLSEISPAAMSSLNSIIDIANAGAQQTDLTFDVRKNLIGNLGDDLISYQKTPAGTTMADLNHAPSLSLFAASNPDQAVIAVKTIFALIYRQQTAPQPRDFLGKKIYTIPLPAQRVPDAIAPVPQSLYCAASGGYVAMTEDVSILESYLRNAQNPAAPLRQTAGLADAAQRVGGTSGGLFGYDNQNEIMRAFFAALKDSTDESAGNLLAPLPKSLTDWMDFSLLPDYDKVAKYFYFSVYAGNTTADGISFEGFAPRPPQLN
jgi:hypothetical protein